ncbi:hypothetical protein SAMN05216567_116146 [Variovorax sp. OK605]|uniref:rolling circle replication-associated protein n=1 Tax=Variovorax sp. OK605 TaxID=1855317 RepID=UPI0008ECE1E2|nr:hypothetical protein [Variovorax sp. OK605]SFQ45729.1 hypothetical protein SAMN05216567_116146 [Variovorax sp. OK605]
MTYLGVRQAEVNAARAASMDALRAFSQRQTARDMEVAEARAARGLVSVSTSGFACLPTAMRWAEECITIDRHQARVTRLRKGVGVGAKALLNLAEGPGENNVMVTLTYRGDNNDWKPRHVSDYIRNVRAWFKDRCPGERLRYVWVAELQQRAVIHYHAVFFLPAGVRMPQADRRGWWPHGMTNTLKATAPVAYLMKYASKVESKNIGGFPRGSRIYGIGGLDAPGAAFKRWVLWPAYVQGNASVQDRFRPAEGGGYINAETGQLLEAEFAPTGGGFQSFIRVRTNARFDFGNEAGVPAGPFSWLAESVTVH